MALEFASRKATFPNYRKFETTFAGRPFVVETGKLCGLANGSAMIRYGETCVLCNVTMSEKPRGRAGLSPLSVELRKLYAAGRIPGSFMRREGRPVNTPSCPPAWLTAPSARCSPRICATMSA